MAYRTRHTHATILLANGVHPKIVSERMEHSTLDTYLHVIAGIQMEVAKCLQMSARQ
ncbi:hypothetical protein GCM10007096_25810 [Pullulanibacillus pueri]|uniref:Tyr recombinase domain-containing protein n=1 Tax=Pullulanibacillus pueri TaxID=1437324 RepID=A0A8J2ZXN3_9BACL|nr:hypothetical protein GCM10007096_25810 [Pullulanibacillus pueri]